LLLENINVESATGFDLFTSRHQAHSKNMLERSTYVVNKID